MNARISKIREWIRRYTPAEIVSLIGTLFGSWLAYQITRSRAGAAIGGTALGNIGYFATILVGDILEAKRQLRARNLPYSLRTFARNVRALIVEFGLAEALDTLLIRPFFLYQFPVWIGDLTWGWIAAKFAADVTFYLPAIFFYEWGKKKYRKF